LDRREIIRMIEAEGWELARIKGSHHHFRHDKRAGIATVPHPRKDVPMKTVRSIERQSGVRLRGRG
jgi:predicted RNA binding protein YcfA (HicA-like mRNA interferase family)